MIHYLILPYYHLTFTCLLQKYHVNLNQTIFWLNKISLLKPQNHPIKDSFHQYKIFVGTVKKFFSIEFYRFSQVEALLTVIMRQILNYLVPDIVKVNFLFDRP